ncbi:Serine/threonine protein kinase PrkC, regulator of stationary phase [Fimbriiglobus ruber]|uniref:non-specific serine/threonine protein kinase n=1 Tax=Fimbriiglobus ruber TaxID=1908690 RepID=A0A225DY23_9BACT|nr:Serine/threonine protein kinase PrkC, regulator of stationary phase [Fimbriiglobus ruber]
MWSKTPSFSQPAPSGSDRLPAEWGEYGGVEHVADGGMGAVYKARNRRLNRVEAVKVVLSGRFAGTRQIERFRFEAEAAAALDHPNIVPVYGVGEVGGIPYFAMKWIEGGDLARYAAGIRHDPRAIAGVMAKVARAVNHAHRMGILHRDLKPSNVLVDADGDPHVTDFGLAKRADASEGMTVTGAVVGTPSYMAPEQARGDRGLTTAVDVYGIGAILYEVLTGRPPFTGRALTEVIKRVAGDPPIRPSDLDPAVNSDLEAVCLKCLEKDPRDRYISARVVAEDLERCARGEPVSVRPPGLWEWAQREVSKTPPHFPGYVWEVKIWFGAIIAASQTGVFALARAGWDVAWVWGSFVGAWATAAVALWWYMAARFTRLPATEQHSVMIAVGHILAQIALTAAVLPWTGPADLALAIYPAMTAISGFSLFVVGTTHWGRFYWFGLAITALAPVCAAWPAAGPLLYGWALAACMWYWAYAVKVTFGTVPPEAADGLNG